MSRAKLKRNGNQIILTLDANLFAASNMHAGSEVEITTTGKKIIITPVKKRAPTKKEAIAYTLREYAPVLKKLADS